MRLESKRYTLKTQQRGIKMIEKTKPATVPATVPCQSATEPATKPCKSAIRKATKPPISSEEEMRKMLLMNLIRSMRREVRRMNSPYVH